MYLALRILFFFQRSTSGSEGLMHEQTAEGSAWTKLAFCSWID
jgi:hypothetical protein